MFAQVMLNRPQESGSDHVIDFGFEGREGLLSLGTSDSDVLRRKQLGVQRHESLVQMHLPDVRFAIDKACDAYLFQVKGLGPEIPEDSANVTDTERILSNANRRDALQEVLGNVVLLEERPDLGPAAQPPRQLPWSYEAVREKLALHIARHLAARQIENLATDHAVLDMNNAQAETETIMTRIFEHPAEDPLALIDAYFSKE